MSSESRSRASIARVPHHASSKTERPPYRAARAFILTLLVGACLVAVTLLRQPYPEPVVPIEQSLLQRRTTFHESNSEDDECRLVHKSKHQCAFIKKHCPSEDAGFAMYLDLYYCRMAHVKPLVFTILISWLGLLFSTIGIAASDFFCINLSTLAAILGMSESIAGVTFLAFGNGSPDVFSTFAAMSSNSGDLAIGELFGAATFITAVVAGSMALIRPFRVPRRSFIRDVGFFTVASCFNLYFLWDGKLHFWECLVMIAYYLVYVTSLVSWHWYKGRRRRKRQAEAAARSAFVPSVHDTDIDYQEYIEDGEDAGVRSRASTFGTHSEDWSALERGGEMDGDEDEEENEAARERWMSELSANMRLTRPSRPRKNTVTPVRPSLVGALEFQAVLKSLQKSRNIQTIPLHPRRYSDDPSFTTLQQQDQMSTISDPAARPHFEVTIHSDATPTLERSNLDVPRTGVVTRNRAVSANDVANLDGNLNLRRRPSPARSDVAGTIRQADWAWGHYRPGTPVDIPSRRGSLKAPDTPVLEVSRATPSHGSYVPEQMRSQSPDKLAPPDAIAPVIHEPRPSTPHSTLRKSSDPFVGRSDAAPVPSARDLPKIFIPRESRSRSRRRGSMASTSQLSPFPSFHDGGTPRSTRPPSLYLPDSLASPESESEDGPFNNPPKKPLRWWPYSILPPPGVLISTLFPTIYHWHEKTWWEKLLGIIAAPSVFCLTVTLPVVEDEKGDTTDAIPELNLDSQRPKSVHSTAGQSSASAVRVPAPHVNNDQQLKPGAASEQTPLLAAPQPIVIEPPELPQDFQLPSPEPWNRWLTMVQALLAPLLCVFSVYIQSPTDLGLQWLIKPVIVCGIVSLVLLLVLLATTTPTYRPEPYRAILSVAGFVVSIAWISVIASQVVGALKALAVILNMSHAIMGLTIFAVGNSLSDLIADITVAKLGFPVMALSACFGGPMLNILLGIGCSGSYILLTRAEHKHDKHPKKPLHFSSYPIEVSNTLLVSGLTLLITLVGLLIFVPMNRWVMSKRIGWTLIVLWIISTVANVALEVLGVGGQASES